MPTFHIELFEGRSVEQKRQFVEAITKANGITSSASYQQFNLSQYYSLSKRTGLYALEAYQRAGGQTLGTNGVSIINATADIGDGQNSAPSSSRSQFAAGVGIIHKF